MKKLKLVSLLLLIQLNTLSQNCNLICNGNFENPIIISAPHFVDSNFLSCWKTSAPDGLMELWDSGYNGVPSFSGNQFLEMNAFFFSVIYQDFIVQPTTLLQIGFAHRGRAGTDSVNISIGPVGGTYVSIGDFGADTVWVYHALNYTIPSGTDSVYRIRFNSIYATLNNPGIGNFLDTITVCGLNVGLHDQSAQASIHVFPTVFNDEIKLKSLETINAEFILLDSFSRVAVRQSFSGTNQIKTHNVKKGIYFYQVKSYNKILRSGKLIKQ